MMRGEGRGGGGRRGKDRGGRGYGGGNKPGSGPGGHCTCPDCGHRISHEAGQRCRDVSCPKCGSPMVRE